MLLGYSILVWLLHYGVFALFFLLALGIVGLPIPDETLIIFAGALIAKNKFNLWLTFFMALGGSIVGITVSYLIGLTAGYYLLEKYGPKVGINKKKINYTKNIFSRWGLWLLLVGYFLPGVRHLTGYLAGTLRVKYQYFALFSYTGALLWVTTFLSIGYFFGNQFSATQLFINHGLVIFVVAIVVLLVALVWWILLSTKKKL